MNKSNSLPFEILSIKGVYEIDAGYLVPESCIENHLNVAEENQAVLKFNEKVVSWSLIESNTVHSENRTVHGQKGNSSNIIENSADPYYSVNTVTSEGIKNTYVCRKIVVAAGPWSNELYGHQMEPFLHVERRVQYWFKPKSDDKTDLFKVFIYLHLHSHY